jgi:hypothetical protein
MLLPVLSDNIRAEIKCQILQCYVALYNERTLYRYTLLVELDTTNQQLGELDTWLRSYGVDPDRPRGNY